MTGPLNCRCSSRGPGRSAACTRRQTQMNTLLMPGQASSVKFSRKSDSQKLHLDPAVCWRLTVLTCSYSAPCRGTPIFCRAAFDAVARARRFDQKPGLNECFGVSTRGTKSWNRRGVDPISGGVPEPEAGSPTGLLRRHADLQRRRRKAWGGQRTGAAAPGC